MTVTYSGLPSATVTYSGLSSTTFNYTGTFTNSGMAPSTVTNNVFPMSTAVRSMSTAVRSYFHNQHQPAVSSVVAIPVPINYRPIVTAEVPLPPNWQANIQDTVFSAVRYKTYKLAQGSPEYQTISNMLNPIQVKSVEQIVNPGLWERFSQTRKEMLCSKSDDMQLLSKLGLTDEELSRRAHLSLNFVKNPQLTQSYADNMVLLYHCTRSKQNHESILAQGLDERLSNVSGGLLGKGIYFSDDPNKAIQYDGTGYIFIFAVLLGDCMSADHFPNRNAFVREPEKIDQQKRNVNDHSFDSIVARPVSVHNEYVIYNR